MAAGIATVVVALAAWLVLRPDTYVAPDRTIRSLQPRPAQAAQALEHLVTAIDARNAGGAAALAPHGDTAAADLLGAVVTNARALHVGDLAMRYVDESGPVSQAGDWSASVDLTWRFDGFDAQPAHEEIQVGFRLDGDTVGIDSFGGGEDRSPLWLDGPLQVRRTPTTLVLTTGTHVADYAKRAAAAVPAVHAVLPGWKPRLVLEIPATEDQLDQELDVPAGTYDNIAAVTAAVDGTTAPGVPIHVFVNPAVLGGLDPKGAQVVISHEATHVATRAPLSAMPIWLLEGFADYVALRDVDLPLSTTAGQIIAEVRKSGPPQALPGQADFAGTNDALGAVYEAAWLACRVVADRDGQAALVDLYMRTDHGQPLDQALEKVMGLSTNEFTALWQQRLRAAAA